MNFEPFKGKMKENFDPMRDSPIRYLGYANEVGEAFRVMISPVIVKLSYAVAFGYVGADTLHKAFKEKSKDDPQAKTITKHVGIKAADTLLWQTFASVFIPGFAINRVCFVSNLLLQKSKKLPPTTRKWVVTAIGLSTIPFIIKPIDDLVDYSMNNTIRKYYHLL